MWEERTRDCSKNLGRLVHRGEMPIELGDSWFSAKAIKVARFLIRVWKGTAIGNPTGREPRNGHTNKRE